MVSPRLEPVTLDDTWLQVTTLIKDTSLLEHTFAITNYKNIFLLHKLTMNILITMLTYPWADLKWADNIKLYYNLKSCQRCIDNFFLLYRCVFLCQWKCNGPYNTCSLFSEKADQISFVSPTTRTELFCILFALLYGPL